LEPKQQLTDFQNTVHKTTSKVKPFFQNNKKLSFILIGVICLIITAYIAGAYLINPQDKVTAFEHAVKNGDVKTLKNLVSSEESNLTIEDKHLQELIDYSRKNKDYLPKLVDGMMSQIHYEEIGISSTARTSDYNDYYLQKTKIPLFYSYYTIHVRPYFLEVSTNETGATVKLDGKQIFKTTDSDKKRTLGPFMPGIYKANAEKKYPYSLLSQDSTISAFDEDDATTETDLQLQGSNLKLEGNFEDTKIFVNGKTIDKTLKDMPEIGPISFNGTIRIHGERPFPWGLEKSPDALVEQDTSSVDITPIPFADKKTQQPIVDLVNKFSKEEMQAHIQHEPNKLTTIDDNLKVRFIQSINDDVQFKYTWKGQVLGTRIDFDNITLSQDESTKVYKTTVPIEIHAKYKKYDQYGFNKGEPLDNKVDQYLLTLTYDEKTKKWLISDQNDQYLNPSDYMKGKNVIKSEFK
jgi:uncharacterized membrane protein YvbJ